MSEDVKLEFSRAAFPFAAKRQARKVWGIFHFRRMTSEDTLMVNNTLVLIP